ncbi:MAG: HAMP domain-containing histidine kinase [Phycisphaerales bacterium]|nr:HAMP domain-containing histidine kinase [Phycisphaerales bacterium]
MSMRLRLTLWMMVIFSVILWTTEGIFLLYQNSAINRVTEESLLDRAQRIKQRITERMPGITIDEIQNIANEEFQFSRFGHVYVELVDMLGRRIIRGGPGQVPSDLIAKFDPNQPRSQYHRLTPEQTEQFAEDYPESVTVPIVHNGTNSLLFIATTDPTATNLRALMRQVLVLAAMIGPLTAAISGWFIAGIAVAPFERLGTFAQRLGPESIGEELTFSSANSEVAKLSRELDEARQRLQAGFKSQERFLSNVSHEIKTPIAVMLTEAQTIDRTGCPTHINDFLDAVGEEMMRLGKLVESFLTLTRLQDGAKLSRLKRYAANDLVMDSLDHCLAMAEQHDVRFDAELLESDDLIDAAILGEHRLLITMLDNLIRNAIRFSPPGGTVRVRCAANNEHIHVSVGDDGPGIPPEIIDHVFDRFAQASDEHRRGRGHGLGLAIAQGIAELHNGSISASNRPAGGAMFTVALPRDRLKSTDSAGSPESTKTSSAKNSPS